MSHGPKISIHHDELTRKDRKEIKELMEVAEVGDEQERLAVAEYLNEQLDTMNGSLFGYWNHRPNQEIEDYDDLIDYFKLYARIATNVKICTALVTADYKDYRWLYDADKEYKVSEEDAVDNYDWFDELKLKRKVKDGEEAREKLESVKEKSTGEGGTAD